MANVHQKSRGDHMALTTPKSPRRARNIPRESSGKDTSNEVTEINNGNSDLPISDDDLPVRGGLSISTESTITKNLADSILEKVENVSASQLGTGSIHKVHKRFKFTKTIEDEYTPELVSIGPFHRGKPALQAMESHKLRYMEALLSRTEHPRAKWDECIQVIGKSEDLVRKCYSEPIELDRKQLIEMMIVDGLFIIELFRRSSLEETTNSDDPIFSNRWCTTSLAHDLILLENQVPMFVLRKLFELTNHSPYRDLQLLAFKFLAWMIGKKEKTLASYPDIEANHLLDLVSKTLQHKPPKWPNRKKATLKHVPCVTELRQAGVKFKKGSDSDGYLNIEFNHGVLEIPPMLIEDLTGCLLQNLIALEQCCAEYHPYITSHTFFMDSLINSAEDVAVLRGKGIITNYLGDDECVSSLFNKLCSEVTLDNFCYSEICDRLNIFHQTRWHVWKANLKRNYFDTPWSVMSVCVAALLIVLTLTATVFAILSFALHHS